MVVLDTDALLLAYAFHRDPRQGANAQFLSLIQERRPAATIYTVMELLGNLSFNLSPARLGQWPVWLQDRWKLTILYPATAGLDAETFFRQQLVDQPLLAMQRHRLAFLDSLILGLAEDAPDVECLVTWNARHFRGKTALTVHTPEEYLAL